MNIYELVYREGGAVDHTVITADSESEARDKWDDYREGHESFLGIDSHGPFRDHDSFEAIREEINERGVPNEYQD